MRTISNNSEHLKFSIHSGYQNLDEKNWINNSLFALFPTLKEIRRDLHKFPEVGWTEYRTSSKIAKRLSDMGWKTYVGKDAIDPDARMGVPSEEYLQECEERAFANGADAHYLEQMRGGLTGVIAEWKTGSPGPTTAFRFDIDSLNILESDSEIHIPAMNSFRSLYNKCMHACGHDGHTAIGLGFAQFIAEHYHKLDLKGTIRLLFQPAEEGCRGAVAMVRKGWLDDVNYFLSGHIGFRSFSLGEVVLNTVDYLSTTKWDATFVGQASHAGGEPELGRNALLAASSAVLNLHAISRHGKGASRINVGRLEGGNGRNIIPAQATMAFETRGQTEDVNRFMSDEAVRILRASAQMYNVELKLEKMGEAGQAEGDPEWVDQLEKILLTGKNIKSVRNSISLEASEDVTHMMKQVQKKGGRATYMLFGTPLPAPHHQALFDFDEQVLLVGLEVYIRTILAVNRTDGLS